MVRSNGSPDSAIDQSETCAHKENEPVNGEKVRHDWRRTSSDDRSYVTPSDAMTGLRMISPEIGQKNSSGSDGYQCGGALVVDGVGVDQSDVVTLSSRQLRPEWTGTEAGRGGTTAVVAGQILSRTQ